MECKSATDKNRLGNKPLLIMLFAAALLLAACDRQPPKTIDEINQLIRLSNESMSVIEKITTGASEATVHEATEKLLTALAAARKQIDAITRRLAASKYYGRRSIDPLDLSTCIDVSLTQVVTIENIPMEALALWVNSAINCVSSTKVYREIASGEDAAAAALAVQLIYPLELVGDAKMRTILKSRLEDYRSTNAAILAKLASRCGKRNSADAGQVRYVCAAHEVAIAIQPKIEALASRLVTSPDL